MPEAGEGPLSEYRLFETEEFRTRLTRLDDRNAERIRRKLDVFVYPQLRREPHFGPNIRRLQGYQPETWRYRIGRFRVFYVIEELEGVVLLVTVDHRKDAYR